MKQFRISAVLLVALACGAFAPRLLAQSAALSYRLLCQTVGTSPPESLGDREGHSISVVQQSCRVEGGPMEGAIMTGSVVYEWDKAQGIGLSGHAVMRKAGATVVLQLGEFKNALTMTDGKATGFLGTGQGSYKLVTGSATVLAGKTFTYVGKPSGPGQYTVEIKVD
jgi:hypothetical protein